MDSAPVTGTAEPATAARSGLYPAVPAARSGLHTVLHPAVPAEAATGLHPAVLAGPTADATTGSEYPTSPTEFFPGVPSCLRPPEHTVFGNLTGKYSRTCYKDHLYIATTCL